MRRVFLVHNPGAARWSQARVDTVVRTLEAEGCQVTARGTTGDGDAVKLAQEAVEHAVDVVAVLGGDGTMIQCVQGLMGSAIPIGLIPGGTGNLLAVNLDIPRDPARAARIIAHGAPRHIDLGQITSEAGTHFFAVASGAGFDADLMARTVGPSKRRWGQVAYVLEALRSVGRIRPARFTLTVDDEVHHLDAATVLVANCRTIMPPLLHLGRGISFDDGAFDIVVLHATNAFQVLSATAKLLTNWTDGVRIRRFRGTHIRLETDRALPVQMDGEPTGTTPLDITMLSRALPVMVPA